MEMSLANLRNEQTAVITRLGGGVEFQRKLRNVGIREGKTARMLARQPLGGPLVIEIGGREITLGRRMASRIIVEV